VARCLIVGCGCRGQALAALLRASGHVVRATTRDPRRLAAIADAGAEAVLADPDRLATLLPALDQVSVVVLPLGSAVGTPELVSALHGPRLAALLEKLIDSPVRGVVYEATGTVDESVLARGAEQVATACARSRIAYELVFAEPAELTLATAAAVGRVLGVRSD
jgi:uncharacterized protein YbjT (DUF2867 family)